MSRKTAIWLAFAALAAFPMIYYGVSLDWNGWTILMVLVWGTIVAGIAATLA